MADWIQARFALLRARLRGLELFYHLVHLLTARLDPRSVSFERSPGTQPTSARERARSEEALRLLLAASHLRGVLKDTERDLFEQLFQFGDKRAKDILVPRVDMVYLSTTWSLEKNLEVARNRPYTRFPLCDGDPDHVIGMVHAKSLLGITASEGADLRTIAREIMMVPETKPIDALLREFQYRKVQMAVVLDEYGGTAGLVTLEDVLEQIVGEIRDEFEEEVAEVQEVGPGRYLVDGALPLLDLRTALGIGIPPNGADTVGGFVLEKLGTVPSPGDFVIAAGHRIEVREMESKRVRKVLVMPEGISNERRAERH